MRSRYLLYQLFALLFLFSGSTIFGQVSVLTQHNDIGRTGQNVNETILTPTNVSSGNFGKLFSLPVDGPIYAQPLYAAGLALPMGTHNVLFVVTEADSVFAFDADAGGAPLWQVSLLDAAHGAATGATPDPASDTGCNDIADPSWGITGTPVIDATTGTMYLVGKTFENGYPVQRLHALNIATGAEQVNSPVTLTASVSGTGSGSSNGVISFDPKWENQRTGLLLLNGIVYIAFGALCDYGPFHGWIMAYNETTLQQTSAFNTTPNGEGSGVWQSGAGLAADVPAGSPFGRLFISTGNGTFDATTPYGTNTADYGDDIVRLDLTNGVMTVLDAFTPYNQAKLQASDGDLSAGGVVILPTETASYYPNQLLAGGKQGVIYVLDRDNLGGYNSTGTTDNVIESINPGFDLYSIPAYWNGNAYYWPIYDRLIQYQFTSGLMNSSYNQLYSSESIASGGSTPSISANGNTNGIVWNVDASAFKTGGNATLLAHNATNVQTTLYSSANVAADAAGPAVKFAVPTIANGKVFVGASGQVSAYGLLSPDFYLSSSPSSLSLSTGGTATDTITVNSVDGFSGNVALAASGLPAGVTASFAPGAAAGTILMTLTSTNTAATGSATVILTGTSGQLSHTVAVIVTVATVPGFTVSAAPASISLAAGQSGNSSISVASTGGFSGTVALAVTGAPGGMTASLGSVSGGAATLTISTTASITAGSYPLSVTGTSGSLSSSATVTVVVGAAPSFTLTASPTAITVIGGQSATGSISVVPANGFSGAVTFAVTGAPTGMTVTLGAVSGGVSTLTVTTTATLPATVYTLSITGTSGTLSASTSVTVTVNPAASFTLSAAQTSLTIAPGQSGSAGVTVAPANGFNSAVTFSLSGAPSGVTYTFAPASSATASTLALSVATAATPGTYPLTITGTSGSLTASTSISLVVAAAPSFTLTASPTAITVTSGQSATGSVSVVPANGFNGAMAFAVTGAPTGMTVTLGAVSGGVSTLTVTTTATLPATVYTLSITGTSGTLSASTSVTVTVNPAASFTLSAAQTSLTIAPGQSGSAGVTVAPANGFNSAVTFSLSGAPSGVTYTFTPASSATASALALSVAAAVVPGTYPLTITGTSGSVTASTSVGLVVAAASQAQTITFNVIPSQIVGTSLLLSATASSGLAVSYGSVTTSVCTLSGSAVTMVGTGDCAILASQAGNATYSAATPVSQSFTVRAAVSPQTITFGTIGAQTVGGTATLTATASSGLAVGFVSTTPTICTVSGNTASFVALGTCTVTASQPGNSSYSTAPSISQNISVTAAIPTSAGIAIDSGGPGAGVFLADTDYSSSSNTYSTTAAIDTSKIANPAPQTVYQTTRYGSFNYTIPNLTPGASYNVNLSFAEIFFLSVGQRQFNVLINGVQVFTNLDMFALAGGPNIAFVETINATATASGTITIQFTAGAADVPQVNSVQILPGTALQTQFITFGAIPTQTVGTPLALAATSSSNLAVSYSSATTSVCSVSGATATFNTSGVCTIMASQAGNSSYAAAAPVSQSFTVSGAPQSITFSPITTQTTSTSLTLTGTASSNLAVRYSSSTTSVCTVSGSTATLLAAGSCGITASQAGNSIYAAATPVSQSFTVNVSAPQTITFGSIGAQAIGGTATLSATATSGLVVNFASTTPTICALSGNTASFLMAGTCTINASQAGGSGYAAAPTVSQNISVSGIAIDSGGSGTGIWLADTDYSGGGGTYTTTAAIDTSKIANPAPQTVYQTTRYGGFTYTVPNLTPGASYNVNLAFAEVFWNSAGQRQFNVLINGVQVFTNLDMFAIAGGENIAFVETIDATATTAGVITIQFTPGAADMPQVNGIEILPGNALQTQITTFGGIATQTVGTPLTLTAASSSNLPVSYNSSTASVCTVSGATVTFLATGTCTITASQAGNSSYGAATPISQSFAVNAPALKAQSVTFGGIAGQTAGTPLALTATASSGLAVSYTASSSSVCSVLGSTASFVAAGTCTVTASQAGNATYAAATPISQSFTVVAPQTITFGSIAAQTVGTTLNLTATASSGLTVNYASSSSSVCTVSGSTANLVTAGTCTITASQAGSATYAAATPLSQSFTVVAPQTITFGSVATQTVGTPLTLTATASSGLAVSYAASPSSVCSVSGTTASFVAAGTCAITASQAGSSTYAAAASVSQSFTVQAITKVSLASAANVYGIFNNGSTVTNGGLDGANYAYSAGLLGTSLVYQSIPYTFGAPGTADSVFATTLALPSGNYSNLSFLGTAIFGNQPSQTFVVTYTDGTTSTFMQSLSDWGSPQNYSGENIASTMAYRLVQAGGQQAGPWYVYAYSFALNSAKTVKSFTLPNSRNVVVLAVTLSSGNLTQTSASNSTAKK